MGLSNLWYLSDVWHAFNDRHVTIFLIGNRFIRDGFTSYEQEVESRSKLILTISYAGKADEQYLSTAFQSMCQIHRIA